jgi:murein L,D-transpeptidase YcbB/YkuD
MKKISAIFIISLFIMPQWQTAFGNGPRPAGMLLEKWFKPVSQNNTSIVADPRLNPHTALRNFYQRRNFQPAWISNRGPLPPLAALLQIIHRAPQDGLRERDYAFWNPETASGLDAIFSYKTGRMNVPVVAALDVALTEAMLRYAAHLSYGRVQPEELSALFSDNEKLPIRDLPGELANAMKDNRIKHFIESLSPHHPQYRTLKQTLQRYRQIQADGGWPRIREGSSLKIGDTGARVKDLHRYLTITGDLQADAWLPDNWFSHPLETAVKRFQRRHGLKADGIVGRRTLTALGIPVETRMIQLMLNMERWRWFPENFGSRYVIVNIPAFELRVVNNRTEALAMRVIVGRKSRPTPVLSSQLTHLEANPYWNIPQKIAQDDLLEKIQDNPEYLVQQGIQVFDSWQEDAPELDPLEIDWSSVSKNYFPFRLRQKPTSRNALGRIKFMFPNSQSVYIHDTPGKSLFNETHRLFSSGCVRVENPVALAVQLLKDRHWDRRRLEKYIEYGQNRTIALQTPFPVYLVYFTAWTDAGGDIHFCEDIYDYDRRLLLSLLNGSPSRGWCRFIAVQGQPARIGDGPVF